MKMWLRTLALAAGLLAVGGTLARSQEKDAPKADPKAKTDPVKSPAAKGTVAVFEDRNGMFRFRVCDADERVVMQCVEGLAKIESMQYEAAVAEAKAALGAAEKRLTAARRAANAAVITGVMAMIAPPISCSTSIVARYGDRCFSFIVARTASATTIASATSTPMARTMANRVIDRPASCAKKKVPSRDRTGASVSSATRRAVAARSGHRPQPDASSISAQPWRRCRGIGTLRHVVFPKCGAIAA